MKTKTHLEKKLIKQLQNLKKIGLLGIKAEFEAEGSNLDDINRLRRITKELNIELHVKIGGVEAYRDLYDCIETNVDGIIAPMVETDFGAFKFKEMLDKVHSYAGTLPEITINIETKSGLKNIRDILKILKKNLNNVTFGRSDLSKSFFDKKIIPDSIRLNQMILSASNICKNFKIKNTVGGSVSKKTWKFYNDHPNFIKNVKKIETRKVIFQKEKFLKNKNSIKEAIEFEKLYILCKKEFIDMRIKQEINRLTELNNRK